MEQDCISTLKGMLQKHDEMQFGQKMEGRIVLSNLNDIDMQLKAKASAYFVSAKEAEEALAKYDSIKYAVEWPYSNKLSSYENMLQNLKKAKEKESIYKESVDNANSFLQ